MRQDIMQVQILSIKSKVTSIEVALLQRRWVRRTSRTSSSTCTSATSCPRSNQNILQCHYDLQILCQQNVCKLRLFCPDLSLNTGYKLPSMKSSRCNTKMSPEYPRMWNSILGVKTPTNETARISINFTPKRSLY